MSQHRHDQERSRKPEQGLLELRLVPLQTGSLCTSPRAAEHPLKSREGGKAAVTSASWDALAAPSDSPAWVAMATGQTPPKPEHQRDGGMATLGTGLRGGQKPLLNTVLRTEDYTCR